MKILFLDDNGMRSNLFFEEMNHHDLTMVETAEDAIKWLGRETYDVVFLDHDLGGKWNTPSDDVSGAAVARFIANMGSSPNSPKPLIIIHSYNEDGADEMKNSLGDVPWLPFGGKAFWKACDSLNEQEARREVVRKFNEPLERWLS